MFDADDDAQDYGFELLQAAAGEDPGNDDVQYNGQAGGQKHDLGLEVDGRVHQSGLKKHNINCPNFVISVEVYRDSLRIHNSYPKLDLF